MGRHDRNDRDRNDRDRNDRDRNDHHRNEHRSRHSEERYSLQELKERARKELNLSRSHRNDEYHRSRGGGERPRRRSRSISGSPNRHRDRPDRRRSFSRSPVRNRNFSNNRGRHQNERGGGGPRHERHFDKNQNNFQRKRDDNNFERPSTSTNNNYNNNQNTTGDDAKPEEKAEVKPNFELTGNLAKDTNMFNGVLIKYNEPPEAKKPRKHWRFYPFKGDTPLDFIPLHRQSAYLFGRDRRVSDIPVDHPSCSKQHAVVQFRSIQIEREDGTKVRVTRPYIIDLESGNGTFVNHKQIEAKRYVELMEQDVVKFGFSTREYVLLHDQSQGNIQEESDVET